MDGWIKISRSITDHWIFSNAVYFKWWIDMLLMANIKDNDVLVGAQVVKLKRGQMIASLNFLATRWSVNKFRVRRFLKLLESERMIETICNKKAQQITICNYASYQDVRNDDATMTQPPCNDDATMTQPNIRKKEGKTSTPLHPPRGKFLRSCRSLFFLSIPCRWRSGWSTSARSGRRTRTTSR